MIADYMNAHGTDFIRPAVPTRVEAVEGGKKRVFYLEVIHARTRTRTRTHAAKKSNITLTLVIKAESMSKSEIEHGDMSTSHQHTHTVFFT